MPKLLNNNKLELSVGLPIALVVTFLWTGFVVAISFMEAWLKFQAPGITLGLGLGIGRLVFGALNKVEWLLAMAIMLNLFISKPAWSKKFIPLSVVFIVLMIQTSWLLPALDIRAEKVINNIQVTDSSLHFYYVGLEGLKVICLSIFGLSLFNKKLISNE